MVLVVPMSVAPPKSQRYVSGGRPPDEVLFKMTLLLAWMVVMVNAACGGVGVTWHVVSFGSKVKAPWIVVVQLVTASFTVTLTLAPMFIVPVRPPTPMQGWVGKVPLNCGVVTNSVLVVEVRPGVGKAACWPSRTWSAPGSANDPVVVRLVPPFWPPEPGVMLKTSGFGTR